MKRLYIIFILIVLFFTKGLGQSVNDKTLADNQKLLKDSTQQAVKVKSGQANDILTNYYQLAIKNIFGSKKEINYSSSIFGLLSNLNNKYKVDTLYSQTRWARNIELSIRGTVDSNTNISGVGGGVKFYLLNARDVTMSNKKMQARLLAYETDLISDLVNAKKKFDQTKLTKFEPSLQKYYKSFDYNDLDKELLDTLRQMHSKIVTGNGIAAIANNYYNEQIKNINEEPLWTLGGTYYHSIANKIDTTTFKSDFLWGISADRGRGFWELNAAVSYQIFNAKALKSSSVQKFHFEAGINRILSENSDGTSKMELKGFGSFDKGYNVQNFATTTKANITYRYLVSQLGGFWIPVTISYDPSKGKLFGFVDLTFNIDPIKK